MKSIICERPNVFKMTNEKAPSIRPGEALVRIKRIGICGTDLHAYKGNQPFFPILEYWGMSCLVSLKRSSIIQKGCKQEIV